MNILENYIVLNIYCNNCKEMYNNNCQMVADPNIPETGEQMHRSIYSSSCCFEHCKGHSLCIASAGDCVNTRHNKAPPGEHCTSGNTVTSSSCSHTTSGSKTGQLNVILFAILLLGHLLLDRRSGKRTTISCK